MANDPLMRAEEAAAYLRTSIWTLAKLKRNRAGPKFYRVGKSPAARYRKSDIDAWMASNLRYSTKDGADVTRT